MSQTAIPTPQADLERLLPILQSTHMTATVETASGTRYTVVARPGVGVVLINDTKGWALRGSKLTLRYGGCMFLADRASGNYIAHTTKVVRVNILTN